MEGVAGVEGAACVGEDDGAQGRAAERSAAVQQEVRYAVARIAHEAGRRERVKVSGKIVDFVAALAENYAAQLTGDVCSFAKHARRSTVTPDDVRLCARNNESIADALDVFERSSAPSTDKGVADWERRAGKQRKRVRQTAIDESNDEHEHCENEDEGDNAFSQM